MKVDKDHVLLSSFVETQFSHIHFMEFIIGIIDII